jgi:peptidyl-prolyl cis-trans isomerase C
VATFNFPKLLRDPFIQFLALGSLVFIVLALVGGRQDRQFNVVLTDTDILRLETLWTNQYSRSPTSEELKGLVDQHIREEILFREAMRLDLGDDDVIVRRRLVQKFLFLSEDMVQIAEPSKKTLEEYFKAHRQEYKLPRQTSFIHIYYSQERSGETAKILASASLAEFVVTADSEDKWRSKGDPFMLQREFAARKDTDISELFGPDFTDALAKLEEGTWAGPIQSAYGWHVVKVLSRKSERSLSWAEVQASVKSDYVAEERRKANLEFYNALRSQYQISIESSAYRGGPE